MQKQITFEEGKKKQHTEKIILEKTTNSRSKQQNIQFGRMNTRELEVTQNTLGGRKRK